MRRVGRFTAALLFVLTGVFILLDQWMGISILSEAIRWWPVLVIILGIEYLIVSGLSSKDGKNVKFAFGSIISSVIIAFVVIVVSSSGSFSQALSNVVNNSVSLMDDAGHKFDKGTMQVPLSPGTKKLDLNNVNGNVVIRTGDVKNVEIQASMTVYWGNEASAQKIADQSKLEYKQNGEVLQLQTKLESRGGFFGSKPKMDLTITVPENDPLDYRIKLENGKIDAANLSILNEFVADTTNGSIELTNMNGSFTVESTNGKITANNIVGNLTAETVNGSIHVEKVSGKIYAETTNGSIYAGSPVANGDWSLETTNGSVRVGIPENGHFNVDASTTIGSLNTEFSLNENKKTLTGQIGEGTFKLKIKTTTGSIHIDKWNLSDVQ